MVYVVLDSKGFFLGAHVEKEQADNMAGSVGEVLEFEKALVYNDREAE